MADATTVVEGKIKFREGKKWKPRWCVLKKPSPVADQLQAVLYKDVNESVKGEAKPKSSFTLDAFFGLEAGFPYDREPHVLAIICQKNISLMAFELRENMIQFEIKIRQSLGEERQFPVKVFKAPSNSRLPKEQVCLMIHDLRFCLIAQSPPKILLSWNIEDLRKFGARDGKFCFEGGTRCGKGTGLFALQSEQAEDIADIVNLASTGKMSNCHRKFKNRSSQIDLGSHLIADISSPPSSSSIHHHHHHQIATRAPPQGALPVTLNCCHDGQPGSADSEDWSWYKRHSVSVMDHHRIAALREKGYLENRDQLIMGIYDVPPCHGRVLEENIGEVPDEPNYACPRPDPEILNALSSSSASCNSTPVTSYTTVSSAEYGDYKKIVPKENINEKENKEDGRQSMLKKRQSASAEFFDYKVSNLEEMISAKEQNGTTMKDTHEESLQRLKKQESDLQREMVLLDEILQNCAAKSQELSSRSHKSTDNTVAAAKLSSTRSGISAVEQGFTIISGNISPRKTVKELETSTPKKMDRTTALRLNTSMPEGTPISPLFHAKLNNIPPTSRLNAPLPYVNLSKYDDESNSHVHLPGSADCVPVSLGSNSLGITDGQRRLGLRGHSSSLSSLHTPVAASSLINLNNPVRDQVILSRQAFGQKLADRVCYLRSQGQSGPRQDNISTPREHQEILVVKMDNQEDPVSYATLQGMSNNDSGNSAKHSSDLVSILTADSKVPVKESNKVIKEEIYENLPVFREQTPPPALPPKGPGLLKKLKTGSSHTGLSSSAQSNVNSSAQNKRSVGPPAQNSSSGCVAQDPKSFGYDNHPRQISFENETQKKSEPKEDNYLMMGSPKVQHKATKSQDPPSKAFVSLETAISPPKGQNRSCVVRRSDYMDMATLGTDNLDSFHEDEIYLDVDETFHARDLYISEADLRLPPTTNINRLVGEGTYMEMANVSTRESVQNSSQTYSNKALLGESVQRHTPATPAVPPPRPPARPKSLKVRHNSDSGISPVKPITPDQPKDVKPKSKQAKSPTKVYSKAKKPNRDSQTLEAPTPFPNLIEFSKKMSDGKSTYVNTVLDSDQNLVPQDLSGNGSRDIPLSVRDVPLPEPIKEGFLARFKRRSSREKNSKEDHEKSSGNKNRNSILERSMSEHESSKATKDDKSSKLKLGRRRSSSFPNRLSYQDSVGENNIGLFQPVDASCSFSSDSSRPKPSLQQTEQSESSSSIQDYSDDSDMSPLLKRGEKRIDPRSLTVLCVQRVDHSPVNPYMPVCKSPDKAKPSVADSSKTDDEKLLEMNQKKKKPVVYQRSSSLEMKKTASDSDQGHYLKLQKAPHAKERRSSFEKLFARFSSSTNHDIPCPHDTPKSPDSMSYNTSSDRSRNSSVSSCSFSVENLDETPPALPPKTRPYQGPLSPVIETAPPIPCVSEPLYIELDDVLPMLEAERAKQEKEKAKAALHNQSIVEQGDGNKWFSKSSVETKEESP